MLNFPEEFGENTSLISLDWDEPNINLMGITREDLESSSNFKPIRIVRINPDNLTVATAGALDLSTEGYANVFSTKQVGQQLYATILKGSAWAPYLLEINLEADNYKVLPVTGSGNGITNLGNSGSTTHLFGFSPVPNSSTMAQVRPVVYDVQKWTAQDLSAVPVMSALGINLKTFYNKEAGEFVALVGSNNKIQLFKYQPATGDFELTEITNPENLSTLINIIGAIKL